MRAGQRRDRVTFRRTISTPDDQGGFVDQVTDLVTVWARFKPVIGGEVNLGDKVSAIGSGTLMIRYWTATAGIVETDTVLIGGVIYHIKGIENIDRKNKDLLITVQKGVST